MWSSSRFAAAMNRGTSDWAADHPLSENTSDLAADRLLSENAAVNELGRLA